MLGTGCSESGTTPETDPTSTAEPNVDAPAAHHEDVVKIDVIERSSTPTTKLDLDTHASVVQLIDLHPTCTEFFGYDTDYKIYIREYWDLWVDFEQNLFDQLETMNRIRYDNERIKRMEKSDDVTELVPETFRSVKSLFKNAYGVGKTARDGMALLDLEKKRTALLGGYSDEKREWAMAVEILMNSVIHDAYYAPLNEEMKAVKAGKHFRSISDDLLMDTDANQYVMQLQRDMIDLQNKYRSLRATILLNKLIDNMASYAELAKAMQRIMRNKESAEFDFDPYMVQAFVRDFESLRQNLLEAENTERFRPSQWSVSKRGNFTMIVGDIKNRMSVMANNVNGPYRRSNWDPWSKPRSKSG